jgi:hypothetical protein
LGIDKGRDKIQALDFSELVFWISIYNFEKFHWVNIIQNV